MWSSGTISRTRLALFAMVGAIWTTAILEITCRFISSGKGPRGLYVRSPASTWTTGTPACADASPAAIAELVSPCTSVAMVCGRAPGTSSRWRSAISAPSFAITWADGSLMVPDTRSTVRRASGVIPAMASTSSQRSVCCPVVTTKGLTTSLCSRAWMTGNILMASGRVPTTTIIRRRSSSATRLSLRSTRES